MQVGFIHFFSRCENSFLCQSTHSPIEEHLGCLQFGEIMNEAATRIHVCSHFMTEKKSCRCHAPLVGVMRTHPFCNILPKTPNPSLMMETKPDKQKLKDILQNTQPGLFRLPGSSNSKGKEVSDTGKDKRFLYGHTFF